MMGLLLAAVKDVVAYDLTIAKKFDLLHNFGRKRRCCDGRQTDTPVSKFFDYTLPCIFVVLDFLEAFSLDPFRGCDRLDQNSGSRP